MSKNTFYNNTTNDSTTKDEKKQSKHGTGE